MAEQKTAESRMQKAVDRLVTDYSEIRAGRANPNVLDKVMVDYYGTPTPINQVGSVSVAEARILVIQPWDKGGISVVEKAILKMVEDKKYSTLRDILLTINPADIAGIFNSLDDKRIPLMFRLLPKELAAETFVEMEPEDQELLVTGFSDNELKELLDELYTLQNNQPMSEEQLIFTKELMESIWEGSL